MAHRTLLIATLVMTLVFAFSLPSAHAQRAFGRNWGTVTSKTDWERFYHYPYIFYPQNFWAEQYFKSGNSLYYRYPPEMRIPVYNRKWYNYYPRPRLYHSGHHFQLDVF